MNAADDAIPLTCARTPDRSLSRLGEFVRILKTSKGRGLLKGAVGIVVQDTLGRCKQGQIAVRLPNQSRYITAYTDEIQRVRP